MGEIVNFPQSADADIDAEMDGELPEVQEVLIEIAQEYLQRATPHLYQKDGVDPLALETIFAAVLLRTCVDQLIHDALSRVGSLEEIERYKNILSEEF